MRNATKIVFRRITGSDFFNINKAPGQETGGGGQSYIDIDTSGVSLAQWRDFFSGITPRVMGGGPAWNFSAGSLGLTGKQDLRISQRRTTTVSIRSQKLLSRASKRVRAWHPRHTNFPVPATPPTSAHDPSIPPLITNLVVYIVRDGQGDYWAGWFQRGAPDPSWTCDLRLQRMFSDDDGYVDLDPIVPFDEADGSWPFRAVAGSPTPTPAAPAPAPAPAPAAPSPAPAAPSPTPVSSSGARRGSGRKGHRQKTDADIVQELFGDDLTNDAPETKDATRQVRVRNQKAVRLLKRLYNECQLTGDRFIFEKSDGVPYTEAHHLIPLGEGGADSPSNLVIVSAHIHRMLHYADVSEIDLSNIDRNQLEITINDEPYTITWHRDHARLVEEATSDEEGVD